MCIRDRIRIERLLLRTRQVRTRADELIALRARLRAERAAAPCLLYTSPSPRDGHLSNSSAASDVYKRQDPDRAPAAADPPGPDAGGRADRLACAPAGRARRSSLSLIHISEPTRRTPL